MTDEIMKPEKRKRNTKKYSELMERYTDREKFKQCKCPRCTNELFYMGKTDFYYSICSECGYEIDRFLEGEKNDE